MPTYEYKCPAGHVFDKFYPAMNSNRRLRGSGMSWQFSPAVPEAEPPSTRKEPR